MEPSAIPSCSSGVSGLPRTWFRWGNLPQSLMTFRCDSAKRSVCCRWFFTSSAPSRSLQPSIICWTRLTHLCRQRLLHQQYTQQRTLKQLQPQRHVAAELQLGPAACTKCSASNQEACNCIMVHFGNHMPRLMLGGGDSHAGLQASLSA